MPLIFERERNILKDIQVIRQRKILYHKANFVSAEFRQLLLALKIYGLAAL